ncbi:ABC transporter ATP-binding protein, partial [Streptomyces sp. SID625]|nr:ABC transporter ATP-binding protein [Streptomyces sp. SID625]
LLYALLRPHRWPSGAALAALVLENALQLVGPLLVARAIDLGIPRASAGDWGPLTWCVAGFAACGLL